jgi:hypothetical protein
MTSIARDEFELLNAEIAEDAEKGALVLTNLRGLSVLCVSNSVDVRLP